MNIKVKAAIRKILANKLRGFHFAPKDRFVTLTSHILSCEEFVLHELYVALSDWDVRHDNYGSFKITDLETAHLMGWKSSATVNRHKNNLIKKDYLTRLGDGYFKVNYYESWTSKYWDKKKLTYARLHTDYAEMHMRDANLHEIEADLVSCKDNVSIDVDLPGVINTVEEFEKAFVTVFWEGEYESMYRASSVIYETPIE